MKDYLDDPSVCCATNDRGLMMPQRFIARTAKRTLDIGVSLVGLVLASPLLLLAAVAVKLSSRGPIFFRQQRMGRNFQPFHILKFRTMVVDAPKLGRQITAGADPRITGVGRFLRKSKIDELPQLINVLIGDMSLVGPRPEVPKYVEMFRDDYQEILRVRPGITDPASIKYRDESAILGQAGDPERVYEEQILPDKIAIARDYVARQSFLGDIAIICRTLAAIAR
jgi:lipopolysaccharide/colanic/teichoic acid biosynthesis glycosyltransferase